MNWCKKKNCRNASFCTDLKWKQQTEVCYETKLHCTSLSAPFPFSRRAGDTLPLPTLQGIHLSNLSILLSKYQLPFLLGGWTYTHPIWLRAASLHFCQALTFASTSYPETDVCSKVCLTQCANLFLPGCVSAPHLHELCPGLLPSLMMC